MTIVSAIILPNIATLRTCLPVTKVTCGTIQIVTGFYICFNDSLCNIKYNNWLLQMILS